MARYQIGSLDASIGYDSRYTDYLRVEYDPEVDTAYVSVKESTAIGGNDGPGGSFSNGYNLKSTIVKPTAKTLLDAIKCVTGNNNYNFKKYGKPTKNFEWSIDNEEKLGLNAKLAQAALNQFNSDDSES